MGGLQVEQGLGQSVEARVVVERPGQKDDRLGQAPPDVLAERGARMLLRAPAGELLEVAVAPVPAGVAEQAEARREQAAVGQVVDGGNELLA